MTESMAAEPLEKELPENLQILSRLGFIVWFACLVAMVILPTTIGAGGSINPLAEKAVLFGLIGPFWWVPALYFQARLLRRQSIFIRLRDLLLLQIILNLPAMILFWFFPYDGDLIKPMMLQKISLLSILQWLSIIGLKPLIFAPLHLPIKQMLRILILDALSFALFWGVFVASTDLSQISVSRVWSIKHRMHTLQTMVETYAVDSNGLFPENTETLLNAAKAGEYFRDLGVSICGYYPLWLALRDLGDPQAPMNQKMVLDKGDPVLPCRLLYIQAQQGRSYFIYGFGPDKKLLQDKDQDFVLSNS